MKVGDQVKVLMMGFGENKSEESVVQAEMDGERRAHAQDMLREMDTTTSETARRAGFLRSHSDIINSIRSLVQQSTGRMGPSGTTPTPVIQTGNMRHANIGIVKVEPTTIFIKDLDLGGLSVTNDAEWVVQHCLDQFGNRKIIYRDSEGQWDELIHDGTQFIDFGPYKGPEPDSISIEQPDMEMKL